jgi:hypothetical protein
MSGSTSVYGKADVFFQPSLTRLISKLGTTDLGYASPMKFETRAAVPCVRFT